MGGVRHFRGALRPSRHSSRGLPSGSAIRCHSSLSCAGAHDSGFVGRASSMWLLEELGIGDSFVLLPRILGCWGSFTRAFLPGRLDIRSLNFCLLIYIIHVSGCGVPVGFFTGFSFIPPLGRQPHGPSPSGLTLRHGASQTYRRLSDIFSERRAHLVRI